MIIQEANRLSSTSEYYFSIKLKEIKALQQSGKSIINIGIGSPDMPPSEEVITELCQTSQHPWNHGYQSYIGIPELRMAISKWMRRIYDVALEPDEILPLMGSKEGIMHIAMAFVNKGDKVLIPNPGYPTYRSVTNLVQGEVLEYRLSEKHKWSIDFEYLSSLPLDEVKLMWVNYPNMPTGVAGNLSQFDQLVKLALKHRFLLVNDNPYSQLFNEASMSIFQVEHAPEVCIELNSLSKSHNMAGWRVGWLTAEQNYIKTILKVKSNMDSGMFLGIQKAAIKALESPDNWTIALRKMYSDRRAVAFNILEALDCTYDHKQGGMFVWGKVPETEDNIELLIDKLIHEAGVFITPGFIFGSVGSRYIRISLCSPLEVLEEARSRVSGFVNKKNTS